MSLRTGGVLLFLLCGCLVASSYAAAAHAKQPVVAKDHYESKMSIATMTQIYDMCQQIHVDEAKEVKPVDNGFDGFIFIFFLIVLIILVLLFAGYVSCKTDDQRSRDKAVINNLKMSMASHLNAHPLLHRVNMPAFNHWWRAMDAKVSDAEERALMANPHAIPFDKFVLTNEITPIPITHTMRSVFYILLMHVIDHIQRKDDDQCRALMSSSSPPPFSSSDSVKRECNVEVSIAAPSPSSATSAITDTGTIAALQPE